MAYNETPMLFSFYQCNENEPIENVLPWAPRLQARAFYGYQAAVENIHSGAPHADLNMSPSR